MDRNWSATEEDLSIASDGEERHLNAGGALWFRGCPVSNTSETLQGFLILFHPFYKM